MQLNAILFCVVMSAIYLSHNMTPKARDRAGVVHLLVAAGFFVWELTR